MKHRHSAPHALSQSQSQSRSMPHIQSRSQSRSQPSSPFVDHKCQLTVHLHPSRLASVIDGVKEQLNGLLLTFVPSLHGIILSYYKQSLPATNTGTIFYERPYINFAVTVTLTVLNLKPQSVLVGTVNKVARDYVGLLIYNTFNAVIDAKKCIPANYQFQLSVNDEDNQFVDSNYSKPSAASAAIAKDRDSGNLTKKQQEKLLKAQAKEARRQAYQQSHGSSQADDNNDSEIVSSSVDGIPNEWRNIRIGSQIRFAVVSVTASDGIVSVAASMTAPDTGLIPGEPVTPHTVLTQRAVAESEAQLAAENAANDIEHIFATHHLHSHESHEQQLMEEQVAAASGQLLIDDSLSLKGMSKKERKSAKKAAKLERKAAKSERKKMRAMGIDSACTAPQSVTAAVSKLTKHKAMMHDDVDSNVVYNNERDHTAIKQRKRASDSAPSSDVKTKKLRTS